MFDISYPNISKYHKEKVLIFLINLQMSLALYLEAFALQIFVPNSGIPSVPVSQPICSGVYS